MSDDLVAFDSDEREGQRSGSSQGIDDHCLGA